MFEREPNKTGRNRSPSKKRSNEHLSVRDKCLIATREAEELSGCINIYPMSPVDYFILGKIGLELFVTKKKGN